MDFVRMRRLAIALITAAPLLLAQGTGINLANGPVLGFVSGSTPVQLQPILGIPGASRLGDALPLPNTVTQLYLAPGHSYALAAQGPVNPIALLILRVPSGSQTNPTIVALPGVLAQPDLVAFSPTGRSAALYSQQENRLQVLTGLPNSPQVARDMPDVHLANNPTKLAISDDAQALLIADGSGAVYALSGNTAPVPVYRTSNVSALAFVSQSHDAVVGDPLLGTVAIVQASGVKVLVPAEGCQPQAAVSTADGKTILIACPAQRLISSIDLASGVANAYKIGNSPSALEAVGARDTFLMSPPDGGTYWLFTWQPEGPVVSFIGALRHVN